MIKICFVTTWYSTFHCFLKSFSKYLQKNGGFEIHLVCDKESVDETDLPKFVYYHQVCMKRGVSLSGISTVRSLKKIFKEENFDIVQYSTPNAAFYASIASKASNIPVRLYCQWGIRYMGFEGWKNKLFKLIEKATCDNSTFIEVESHGIRSFAINEKLFDENKSTVIWNGSACGVDLKKFDINNKARWREEIRTRYGFHKDDVVLSFAGRLTADKGINELFDAFLKIKSARAKLLIMGPMESERSLNQELYKRVIENENIVFTGNVEDIERYYAASDVFVSPSYREGFGLVVVEAESMGVPVIVSDVPGQIDTIIPNETGLSFEVKNAESLREALSSLICNETKRKQMGESAAAFACKSFEQEELFQRLKQNRIELVQRG